MSEHMKNQSTVEVPVTDQSNATPNWYDYTNASYTIEEWLPQLVSANQLGIQALYDPQGWVNHVFVPSRFAWAKSKPIRGPLISSIQCNGSLAEISSKKLEDPRACRNVWVYGWLSIPDSAHTQPGWTVMKNFTCYFEVFDTSEYWRAFVRISFFRSFVWSRQSSRNFNDRI